MALSYHGIARAAGAQVPFWDMLKVTCVANTVNYLVTTGGLSGFAVRLYFFMRMAIPSGTAVVIALVQTFITNSVLLLFVVGGFAYLLTTHDLHGFTLVMLCLLLAVFFLAAGVVVALLINRELRRRTLFVLAEATHRFLHRFLPRHKPGRVRIWRFQRNLNRGIDFLLARKRSMVIPTLWIVVDWVVTLLILKAAFAAVRYPIPLSFVTVGFAVGVALSMVSFIPGGLGVMEGSMAAIFVSLSVPVRNRGRRRPHLPGRLLRGAAGPQCVLFPRHAGPRDASAAGRARAGSPRRVSVRPDPHRRNRASHRI